MSLCSSVYYCSCSERFHGFDIVREANEYLLLFLCSHVRRRHRVNYCLSRAGSNFVNPKPLLAKNALATSPCPLLIFISVTNARRRNANLRLLGKARNYEGSSKFVTHFNSKATAAEAYERGLPSGMAADKTYTSWMKSQPWPPLVKVRGTRFARDFPTTKIRSDL